MPVSSFLWNDWTVCVQKRLSTNVNWQPNFAAVCMWPLSPSLSICLHIPELFLTPLSRNLERKWWIFHMQNELRSMRKQDNKETVCLFIYQTKYPHPFYVLMGGSAYQNHDGLHSVIIKTTWLIYNSASSRVSLDMNFRNNSRKKAISTWWNGATSAVRVKQACVCRWNTQETDCVKKKTFWCCSKAYVGR